MASGLMNSPWGGFGWDFGGSVYKGRGGVRQDGAAARARNSTGTILGQSWVLCV